jgi:DNA repair exonuclease SbcCD ATPase subunit
MEKLNFEKNTDVNKKVFLRKEIEADRLGEELYSDDILSHYSVYILRKFEWSVDYQELMQIEELLEDVPEQFNQAFDDYMIKKLYLRVTAKAAYLTVLLALAQPLNKEQIHELRNWFSNLNVMTPALEHVSKFSEEIPLEMVKGLQETNSEVLLLSEMMNQFYENLNDVYSEIQTIKEKRTPPIVKVVPSKAVGKQALESENSKKIEGLSQKLEQLMAEFAETKAHMNDTVAQRSKAKKPPKFKIVLGPGDEAAPTLESRLEKALAKIDQLNQAVQDSDQKIAALNQSIKREKQKKPKVTFATARTVDQRQTELTQKLAETGQDIMNITTQLEQMNQKLVTIEQSTIKDELIERIEKDHGQLQNTVSETVNLSQGISQLTNKLQTIEAELSNKQQLTEQQQKEQAQLLTNIAEIKKLTKTVANVDSQITQANQRIAALELQLHQAIKSNKTTVQEANPSIRPLAPVAANHTYLQENEKISSENKRNFPSKETFLQASKPARSAEQAGERQTVTLAIEEMLERVSEKHPRPDSSIRPWSDQANDKQHSKRDIATLSQLKKLEWDIHALFQVSRGRGHKGMLPKKEFYASIRKIEVLPYLWLSVFEREKKDLLLGNELSCQQLIEALPGFLEEVNEISQKRKVMGKWLYCPKEIEQKIAGYVLLGEYFEAYLEQ